MKTKFDEIQDVQRRWVGGLIGADHAMSLITNILDSKCVVGHDVSIANAATGETIAKVDSVSIHFRS